MRHMTLGAGKLHAQVGGVLLLPGLVRMALFAFEVNGLFAGLAELDDAFVGVMAQNAFHHCMLTLEEVAVFNIVLDKSVFGCQRISGIAPMAGRASL